MIIIERRFHLEEAGVTEEANVFEDAGVLRTGLLSYFLSSRWISFSKRCIDFERS